MALEENLDEDLQKVIMALPKKKKYSAENILLIGKIVYGDAKTYVFKVKKDVKSYLFRTKMGRSSSYPMNDCLFYCVNKKDISLSLKQHKHFPLIIFQSCA